MIKSVLRISLAGLGALAVLGTNVALTPAIILGAFVSIPALSIAGGSILLYQGTALAISSLATGSLQALFLGLVLGHVGWFALETYNFRPIVGIAEKLINNAANSWSTGVVKILNRKAVQAEPAAT